MTTKSTLKILLLVSLLVTIVFVSGCTGICGPVSGSSDYNPTTYSSPTATATAIVTPVATAIPGPTNTTENQTAPSAMPTVTPTVTPTQIVNPLYNASNPYAAPGWPTYGVYYYLNMSDVPPSTGSIFGYVYYPMPSGSPMPVDSSYYGVHVERVDGLMAPKNLTLDSSGRYEIKDLSYGDYYVSWYFFSPGPEDMTETVTLDAEHQNVQQDFEVWT